MARQLGANFAITPDHVFEVLMESAAAARNVMIEVPLSQRKQPHQRIAHYAGDLARRELRAGALDCEAFRCGDSVFRILEYAVAQSTATRTGVALHVGPASSGSMRVIHSRMKVGHECCSRTNFGLWSFTQIHPFPPQAMNCRFNQPSSRPPACEAFRLRDRVFPAALVQETCPCSGST